jgi:hypothetical protein
LKSPGASAKRWLPVSGFQTFISELDFKWLSERLINVLTFIGGALIVGWQINKQFRNSQNLQKENKANELKLKIYESIIEMTSKATEEVTTAMTSFTLVPFNLRRTLGMRERDKYGAVKLNPLEFQLKHGAAEVAVGSLTTAIRRFEIVRPELSIFVIVLNSQPQKIKALSNRVFEAFAHIMPLDITNGFLNAKNSTTEEDISNLMLLVGSYQSEMLNLAVYIQDYEVEAQNELLGGIFDGKAARRSPKNKRSLVITTRKEDREKILSYFSVNE